MGQNALSVFQKSGGAVEKTLAVVAEYLNPMRQERRCDPWFIKLKR
jgi:hypothetical protein